MSTELAPQDQAALLEKAIIGGDLAQLSPAERLGYYRQTCESLGLNPLTRPFDFLKDRAGKLRLYARRECTDQLRRIHGISTRVVQQERIDDLFCVTVEATDPTGRIDTDLGVVAIAGLTGEDLANAMLKAITKGKRRATLSLCGLSLLDETEVDVVGQVVSEEQVEIESIQAEVNDWLKAGSFTKAALEGWAKELLPCDGKGKILWKQGALDAWTALRETAKVYAAQPTEG